MIADVWHCPKCGSEIESAGVIHTNGQDCSVFQCDSCVIVKPIFGRPFDVALTFAVNDAGRPFDPVDDEPVD
jgi:uncharacterized Zn finger protein